MGRRELNKAKQTVRNVTGSVHLSADDRVEEKSIICSSVRADGAKLLHCWASTLQLYYQGKKIKHIKTLIHLRLPQKRGWQQYSNKMPITVLKKHFSRFRTHLNCGKPTLWQHLCKSSTVTLVTDSKSRRKAMLALSGQTNTPDQHFSSQSKCQTKKATGNMESLLWMWLFGRLQPLLVMSTDVRKSAAK